MINALIERWRPETHTFHFPVGECAVTLEDVAMILDLPTNGLSVTGPTMSSFEAMEAECLHHFGVAPTIKECRGSFIKLTWFRRLKERIVLTDDFHIQMWQNWERENYGYRYHSVPHYRRLLDDMQEGHAYGIGHVGPDLIPLDIRHNSVIWSARVPLISFECVEWHATDRIRRQFGLNQGVPDQPRDLGASHGEVLTGPKNQDWANMHSVWVMEWTNRYSHVLVDKMGPPHYSLDTYMHWYRGAFGDHLQLSDLVAQENPEGPRATATSTFTPPSPPPPQAQQDVEYFAPYVPHTQPSDYLSPSVPIHQQYWGGPQFETGEQGSFSQLLGFMGSSGVGHSYSGNYADIPADHWARSGGVTQPRRSLDLRPRDRTSSDNSRDRMSVDLSRSAEAAGGIIQTRNKGHIPMSLIQESNMGVDDDIDDYLVDHPESDGNHDDEDEDEDDSEDDDDDIADDPADQADEDRADNPTASAGTATSEKGKGYNLREDPPRRSASRYTPSPFNKLAKKCKKLCTGLKWAARK
ncbi:uncharacterized protein DS421_18g632910 [Arachis hypogaea]|nr:uncharacterized protein DS421_18g632910 [Arachis hypogaea]